MSYKHILNCNFIILRVCYRCFCLLLFILHSYIYLYDIIKNNNKPVFIKYYECGKSINIIVVDCRIRVCTCLYGRVWTKQRFAINSLDFYLITCFLNFLLVLCFHCPLTDTAHDCILTHERIIWKTTKYLILLKLWYACKQTRSREWGTLFKVC